MTSIVPTERITNKIYLLRGKKVLMDRDLAELYGVETAQLKRAVKRNIERFPDDFMFELTKQELDNWRCQFGTSNSEKMGLRYRPMVFTEQGVAMLSSVLRSKRAIEVNIVIMRAFVRLREMMTSNLELARKLEEMEKKYDEQFKVVFDAIRALMVETKKPKRKIGFEVKESRAAYGRRAAGRKA
jgi:hypothetical protein